MHAGRRAEWGVTGLQGSGCWTPRTDAHRFSQLGKAAQLLGQQPLPGPLAPTSSTHSSIPGGPEPRTQGQGGPSTPQHPPRAEPREIPAPPGSCVTAAYLWRC